MIIVIIIIISGLSDADLMTLSEMLVKVDDNNVADKVVLDYGCRTNSGNDEDCSPNPLFQSVSESVFVLPTFSRLIALYDNYNSDVGVVEDHIDSLSLTGDQVKEYRQSWEETWHSYAQPGMDFTRWAESEAPPLGSPG